MHEYVIYDDQKLLRLVSEGDSLAFTELYHRHKDKLYGFSLDIVGCPEKASDLVQDVFLKIWEKRASLLDKEIFASYLFTMVKNLSIDHFRKFAKEAVINQQMAAVAKNSTENPESSLLYRDLETKVQQAINNLPPRQREIYILHKEERLKYNEIAQKLNISVSTVENHFSRAMVSIRGALHNEYTSPLSYLLVLGISVPF